MNSSRHQTPSVVLLLSLGVVLAARNDAVAATLPTIRSITIDGDFSDWLEILANPRNTSRDDDGSTTPCAVSTDRDCKVTEVALDVLRFAWTYDDTFLYAYFERLSGSATEEFFALYLDLDRDGLMRASDKVLVLALRTDTRNADADLFPYLPNDPGGDRLIDASGFADGYKLPGTTTGAGSGGRAGPAQGDAPGGAVYETAIRWNQLGMGPGAPLFFHVSAGKGALLSLGIKDNMGGPGGLVGDTAWRAVGMTPDLVRGVAPGGVVTLPHVATNAGNLAGTIELRAISAAGLDISWSLDADGDGTCETALGFDEFGDGVFTGPGDFLAPGADTDGNTILDLGVVPPGGSRSVCLDVAVPISAGGMTDVIDIVASHAEDPLAEGRASDLLRVGDVTIAAGHTRTGVAGQPAWFPHVLQDNLAVGATVNLSAISVLGWTWSFFSDPDGDGDPADAAALDDSDGDGLVDVVLAAGEMRPILARCAIPAASPLGRQETVFLRAHLDGPPLSALTDRLVVGNPISVVPDYLLAEGNARYGGEGSSIYFAHRILNGGSSGTSFDVTAASDFGWPVTLLCDPDGDGRPYDAVPLPPGSVIVGGNGGEHPIIVRVDVPAGALVGDVSRITLRAADAGDPSAFAEAQADAVAAIVRVYDDAARIIDVSRVPECGTAYCLATGLPASAAGYRFTWRDPSGTLVRLLDVSTDAAGEIRDEMAQGPTDAGPGWTVAIQRDEGGAWATLDVATYAIGDALEVAGLATGPPSYDLRDTSIAAILDVRNASFDTAIAGARLRWIVLTPDRSLILEAAGSFAAYSGTEATRTDALDLAAGEQRTFPLDVSGIAFPSTGDYPIEIWRTTPCGSESLVVAGTLRVMDDADRDGIERGDELAAGLDPDDPDSDDDGLQDGADGLTDSDADGVIDALDCDSDGDGLADGLEAGVSTAGPGTDVARGCFRADADPTTMTDPDAADTDGGGATDGSEDGDGNGRLDAGERDPAVALDDAAGCSTSAPAEVLDLRMRRAGADAAISWNPARDPCTTWLVESADALPSFALLARALDAASHADGTPLGPGGIRFYLVRAESWLTGIGP